MNLQCIDIFELARVQKFKTLLHVCVNMHMSLFVYIYIYEGIWWQWSVFHVPVMCDT